jgi:hypothetical protein
MTVTGWCLRVRGCERCSPNMHNIGDKWLSCRRWLLQWLSPVARSSSSQVSQPRLGHCELSPFSNLDTVDRESCLCVLWWERTQEDKLSSILRCHPLCHFSSQPTLRIWTSPQLTIVHTWNMWEFFISPRWGSLHIWMCGMVFKHTTLNYNLKLSVYIC